MQLTAGASPDVLAPIRATAIRYFAQVSGVAVAGLLIASTWHRESPAALLSYGGLMLSMALASWLRTRNLPLSGALCSFPSLVFVTLLIVEHGGIAHPAGPMTFATLVAVAALCWNTRGAAVIAILSSGILGWLLSMQPQDLRFSLLQTWVELSLQLLLMLVLVHFALKVLERAYATGFAHEARFRELIERSPEAIVGLDEANVVRIFNASAVKLTEVSADSALSRPLSDLAWLTPEHLKGLEQKVKQATKGTPTATLLINPGEKREFEANIARILHHEEAADCMLTLRDVTERQAAVRAREAFEARTAQAKSMEALGRLAGGVAHDFNNMLTVISGTVELLLTHSRTGGLNEMQRYELTNIFDAAARAAALTSQLLAFGRKQMLQPRIVSPRETLTSLLPMLQRLVREDVQLVISVEPDLGNIRVDETRLEQVIMNLVTNGCEAMSRGGKLTIDVKNCVVASSGSDVGVVPGALGGLAPLNGSAGPHVAISVRDTGDGLTEDARNRMFEPFFTTKAGSGGTGLGLATVHGIVAQSAGHIAVESALGQGTCVSVFFPRVDEAVAQQQAHQLPRRRVGKARALLIEDEGNVRWSTRQLLETLHLEVEEASRGSEALEKYGSRIQSFDVLICDVIMPGMSGVEVAREFTSRHPPLRVLLISGYAKDAVDEISELGQGVRFLPKPFSRAALDETLNELLAK